MPAIDRYIPECWHRQVPGIRPRTWAATGVQGDRKAHDWSPGRIPGKTADQVMVISGPWKAGENHLLPE